MVGRFLRHSVDWKSPSLKGVGHCGPKFQVQGTSPSTVLLRVGKLDELTFHTV